MDEFYEQKCMSCNASEEECFLCLRKLRKNINAMKTKRIAESTSTEQLYDIPDYAINFVAKSI